MGNILQLPLQPTYVELYCYDFHDGIDNYDVYEIVKGTTVRVFLENTNQYRSPEKQIIEMKHCTILEMNPISIQYSDVLDMDSEFRQNKQYYTFIC